jgi:hypothetical protein
MRQILVGGGAQKNLGRIFYNEFCMGQKLKTQSSSDTSYSRSLGEINSSGTTATSFRANNP